MRQRNKPWVEPELDNNPHMTTNAKDNKGKWQQLFNNDNDIHLEIGCGKGDFVVGMAVMHPDINFVAFEKEKQVIASAVRKVRETEDELGIKLNVFFILGDATEILEYFDKGEIKRIYLNFSDPWRNRKKWNKRRLTHRDFLENYKQLFDKEGSIHQKTDNKDLFEFSLNEFSYADYKLSDITFDLHNSDFTGNVITEYETKFSSQGLPIYRVCAYWHE